MREEKREWVGSDGWLSVLGDYGESESMHNRKRAAAGRSQDIATVEGGGL